MPARFAAPPNSAAGLLSQARRALADAEEQADAGERFRLAHLAALRAAAAVVAERGRPAAARRRLVSVWVLLDSITPELREWAALFAARAPLRAAIEAGALHPVSSRQADDQVRDAATFLALAEGVIDGRAGGRQDVLENGPVDGLFDGLFDGPVDDAAGTFRGRLAAPLAS